MPSIMLRLDDAEHKAMKNAAAAVHLPVAAWARSELMKLAAKAPPASAADLADLETPKSRRGRPETSDGDYLDDFTEGRFPSLAPGAIATCEPIAPGFIGTMNLPTWPTSLICWHTRASAAASSKAGPIWRIISKTDDAT